MAGPSPDLRIDRLAPVERHPLGDTAWVEVAAGFVPDAAAVLAELAESTPWSRREVLRYDRYIPERRLGAGLRADAHPMLRQTGLHLESRYHQRFEGVAAILYRDGADFQGLHSDREMRWLDDTLIAIVVLGARRPFVLRERAPWSTVTERVPAGADAGDLVLTPGEGDLLVMGGSAQRDWLHGVPEAPGVDAARISLTWRWTDRRGRPDTNPTHYDGRHFGGDRPRPGSRTRRAG